MDWCDKCAVIIPCLNEEASVAPLARAVQAHVHTVVAVDDGSSDATSTTAREAGAKVLIHDYNRGKGAALKTGLETAYRDGFEWGLTMDADNQHSPVDIPKFFGCAQDPDVAMVVGNRMHNPHSIPWVRRNVNLWMSRRISEIAGQPLPDSQCGFRLIRLKLWSELRPQASRFEVESEMLLSFLRAGFPVKFVPITVINSQRPSRIKPIGDTIRWLRWWREAKRAARSA